MTGEARRVVILVAEDDDDDFFLMEKGMRQQRVLNGLYHVRDGQELMDYLLRKAGYQDPVSSPAPHLILLDLNMPRKDGREALREIKAHPALRHIPVVVLTTSKAEEDVMRSYDLGASSYIRKPVGLDALGEALRVLGRYWFEVVELPQAEEPMR